MDSKDTSHLYFNIQLSNPSTATSAIACSINQDFPANILACAADFKACITRLSLPMSSLPYFQVPKQGPDPDPGYTFYLTLSWRGTDYKQGVGLLSAATGDTTNVYYINQFIDSVNAAFALAYAAVIAANPSDAMLFPGHAPYIQFNQNSQLCTLVTDLNTWEGVSPTNGAIYFNTPLMALFANMPNTLRSYNAANKKDNMIAVTNRGAADASAYPNQPPNNTSQGFTGSRLTSALVVGTTYTTLSVTATTVALPSGTSLNINNSFAQFPIVLSAAAAIGATTLNVNSFTAVQAEAVNVPVFFFYPWQISTVDETPSVLNWWSTDRIVVTTGRIPARGEGLPTTLGNIGTQPILTDFLVTPADRLSGNNSLLMIPQPQYRWFDLMSDTALRGLDMRFQAADYQGTLTDIYLAPGQCASVKILFERKTTDAIHLDSDERRQKCGGGPHVSKWRRIERTMY